MICKFTLSVFLGSNNPNSHRRDNVYGAIIMAQLLQEFTQTVPGGCRSLDNS